MTIKQQFKKIKENWLILVLVLVLFLLVSPGISILQTSVSRSFDGGFGIAQDYDVMEEMAYSKAMIAPGMYPEVSFAPEIEERIITKTASISTEVERGTFKESESKLKNIIRSSDSFLLNENVNEYERDRKSYYQGNYQIKVDVKKYDSVVSQLKSIGEINSFNEDQSDITRRYTNKQIELETEKERLVRFKEMYAKAERMEDKIELNDRIFNQERTIKYLEESMKNLDQRVDYSTIHFSMTEKRSEYANVIFVKFSELIKNFVNSLNSLINWIFVLIPWIIAGLIILFAVRSFRKKKK